MPRKLDRVCARLCNVEGESTGLIGATLGAIVVLAVYHLIRRKPASA